MAESQYIPRVSIVMPMYDSKEFVAEAIRSIQRQTFEDFEFIIVDDSTDGSADIVAEMARADLRIKHIHNEPAVGLRKSSNMALDMARGEYIVRMESDDISEPDRLKTQVKFMDENPDIDVSGCFLRLFGDEEGKWTYPTSDEEIKAGLVWTITVAHPTTIFRRSFVVEHNFRYNEEGKPYAEDWELFYDMSSKARFANIPEILYNYRRSSGSVTKRMKEHREGTKRKLFARIIQDLGLEASEQNLDRHQFIMGNMGSPSPEDVEQARRWLDDLIMHNRNRGQFDQEAFSKICEKHWGQLFYKLVPYGKKVVRTYFNVTPGRLNDKKTYFLKHRVNRLLGRGQ